MIPRRSKENPVAVYWAEPDAAARRYVRTIVGDEAVALITLTPTLHVFYACVVGTNDPQYGPYEQMMAFVTASLERRGYRIIPRERIQRFIATK